MTKSKIKLKPLSEQVVVITGATSGIGLATAREAADRDAKLVLVSRDTDSLTKMVDEFKVKGVEALAVTADVGKAEDHVRILKEAIDRFARVDTWVNNAGVSIFGKIEDVSFEDQRKLFDTNFWGVVYGSVTAARYLKENGGALINLGSELSDAVVPLQGAYSASKHAVKGYTDALRMELENDKAPVSVTLIKPASIDTSFVRNAKNYLDVEPKLPPPLYAPELVADAILYAAEHPIRDVYVGGASRAASTLARSMPRVMDWLGGVFINQQRTDRPPVEAKGALYESRRSPALRANAGAGAPVFERCAYTYMSTHGRSFALMGLAAATAVVVVGALAGKRR